MKKEDCQHHWLLDDPHDGQIQGKCQKCKLVRVYPSEYEAIRTRSYNGRQGLALREEMRG